MCKVELNKDIKVEGIRYINFQTKEELDWNIVSELADNAMLKHRPDLWEVWDFNQNIKEDIYKVTYGSGRKVFFKCVGCENILLQVIKNKVNGHSCNICLGKVASESHNLGILYPQLIKDWHPIKNGDLTPYDITPSSEKQKIWWQCELGHEWEALSGDRKNGKGCPYCTNRIIIKGFNNISHTNPEIIPLLVDIEDGNKYSSGSAEKIKFKCECGNVLCKPINDIIKNGIRCPKCSDGISIGEKAMYHLLSDNNIDFKYDSTTSFSQGRRYDFIIEEFKLIIEIDGEQHKNGAFEDIGGRSLEEEIENDIYKKKLAIQNGYEDYYSIEIVNKDIKMFSENVIKSGVLQKLNINVVDWLDIEKKSLTSLVFDVCKAYNENTMYSTMDLVNVFKLSSTTIRKYLQIGQKLGICSYDKTSENYKFRMNKCRSNPVVQLDMNHRIIDIYHSMSDAGKKVYGNRQSGRSIKKRCLEKGSNYLGYMWMFLSDYEKQYGKLS